MSSVGQTQQTMVTMGLLLLVYVPKIVLLVFMLGEDIFRVGAGSINYFDDNERADFLNSRRNL
jgi:hypothetical protein